MIKNDDVRRAANPDMTSDPEDPHGWMFDCEVIPLAVRRTGTVFRLKAWWVCRRCGTTIRLAVNVTPMPHSGNGAYDEMAALSRLSVLANVERGTVHPRCSEVRTVKHVMTS